MIEHLNISAALHRGAAAAAGSTNGEYESAANFRLPWLRKLNTEAEVRAVLVAASEDNDSIVKPSHVIELEGQIAGAVSLGTVTLLDVWAHRQRLKARQSVHLLNLVENLAALMGAKNVCLPCADHSPYKPYMEKFGFNYAGNTGIYYKTL